MISRVVVVLRIGDYVAEHGLGGNGSYKAARDLLLRARLKKRRQPLRL